MCVHFRLEIVTLSLIRKADFLEKKQESVGVYNIYLPRQVYILL